MNTPISLATPERPQGVQGVDVTSQNLVLQWVEPHNSNAPIIGYRVMYRQPAFQGGADVELNVSETSLFVMNLLPGITYNFTVVAFNEIGNSPPSDITPVRTLDKGWLVVLLFPIVTNWSHIPCSTHWLPTKCHCCKNNFYSH